MVAISFFVKSYFRVGGIKYTSITYPIIDFAHFYDLMGCKINQKKFGSTLLSWDS